MLSYRHAFHAGNFADVLKHFTLIQLIDYLQQKDKAVCYIDTHAGAGGYALNSDYALKNSEFVSGIGKLWTQEVLPTALERYVSLIKSLNVGKQLLRYPGSPLISKHLLRPQDRMVLFELHSTEIKLLHTLMKRDPRITVNHDDGLSNAIKLLPPKERRGLILIDPSYEMKTDYAQVVDTLEKMYKRFATGTYALWYPVIERRRIDKLENKLRLSGIKNMQLFELAIAADGVNSGMTACGMIVINPPWTLKAQMQEVLPYLVQQLSDNVGFFRIEQLADE